MVVVDSTNPQLLADASGTNAVGLAGANPGAFRLPSKGRLKAVSVIARAAAQPPAKVNAFVSLGRLNGPEIELVEGWIRGESNAIRRQSLQWHGDIPLPTKRENFVNFAVRNETGEAIVWQGSWVVE